MVTVSAVRKESADTCTLWLEGALRFTPGQFVMIWLPGVDEKPYSISGEAPGRIAITVRRRGRFSSLLADRRSGDRIGLRGPYGKGFSPEPPVVIVAGGCGIAAVAPLKERLPEAVLIAGARTAEEILFRDRFPDMLVCTDDGTAGYRGFPTELLERTLDRDTVKTVCACGPEPMLRAVFEMCERRKVECQVGLERYMKCGIGVCGHCSCGDRLVCRDGPVFDSSALRTMADFGRTARLKDGRVVSIEEYATWCSV